MSVPIALTTYVADKTRLGYFLDTIASLEASDANLDAMHIYDDHSPLEEKQAVLKSLPYPYHEREERLGTYVNTRLAISDLFERYPKDDLVVMLQDDIEVSRSWLAAGMETMRLAVDEQKRMGILSLFHFRAHPQATRYGPKGRQYRIMDSGHVGAVGWVVNRMFWEAFISEYEIANQELLLARNDRGKKHDRAHLVDWKITRCAHIMKWKIGFTEKSLLQHRGKKSSLHNMDMEFTKSPFYVGVEV